MGENPFHLVHAKPNENKKKKTGAGSRGLIIRRGPGQGQARVRQRAGLAWAVEGGMDAPDGCTGRFRNLGPNPCPQPPLPSSTPQCLPLSLPSTSSALIRAPIPALILALILTLALALNPPFLAPSPSRPLVLNPLKFMRATCWLYRARAEGGGPPLPTCFISPFCAPLTTRHQSLRSSCSSTRTPSRVMMWISTASPV